MAALGPIKVGDIVEVDVRGTMFKADVTSKERSRLGITPIDRKTREWLPHSHATVTARQVKRHWRQTKNTTKRASRDTGHDA